MIRLKPKDIDEARMLIHVRKAKGQKDRYTLLGKAALAELKKHWEQCPLVSWVFLGDREAGYLSKQIAQKVFKAAARG